MKLKYEKPMAAVDRYELSQSIAGCLINVNSTGSTCFLTTDGIPPMMKEFAASGWFVDPVGCMIQTAEGTTFDGICIHTSANGAIKS